MLKSYKWMRLDWSGLGLVWHRNLWTLMFYEHCSEDTGCFRILIFQACVCTICQILVGPETRSQQSHLLTDLCLWRPPFCEILQTMLFRNISGIGQRLNLLWWWRRGNKGCGELGNSGRVVAAWGEVTSSKLDRLTLPSSSSSCLNWQHCWSKK